MYLRHDGFAILQMALAKLYSIVFSIFLQYNAVLSSF